MSRGDVRQRVRKKAGAGKKLHRGKARHFTKPGMVSSAARYKLKKQVADLTRELKEAREQQIATADVLKVISRSTFNLQTVLDTLVESAAQLCGANVTQLFRLDGNILRWVAGFALNPAYLEIQKDRVYAPG